VIGEVSDEMLTPWKDIPVECGFRVKHRGARGKHREVTQMEKRTQQQTYAECKQWAMRCGLSAEEFGAKLKEIPKRELRYQFGRADLAKCLQCKNATQWQHAKLACIEMAIRKVAAKAAREVGGERLVHEAADEMSDLLSSESVRLSRMFSIPKLWRVNSGLNLPTDCYRTLDYSW
jgi:hypothetical protein